MSAPEPTPAAVEEVKAVEAVVPATEPATTATPAAPAADPPKADEAAPTPAPVGRLLSRLKSYLTPLQAAAPAPEAKVEVSNFFPILLLLTWLIFH
jgi:hypothetical protein